MPLPAIGQIFGRIYRAIESISIVRLICCLFITDLEMLIIRNMSHTSKIKKLLPRILQSDNATHFLGRILGDSALVGHWETYQLVAPTVFERVALPGYKEVVTEALSLCISKASSAIAQDLVSKILLIPQAELRAQLLGWALICSAQENNVGFAERLLREDVGHRYVHIALQCSASRNHSQATTLFLDDILNEEIAENRALDAPPTPQGRRTSIVSYQCYSITSALTSAINSDCYETIAVLLTAFLACMQKIDAASQHSFHRNTILARVPLEGVEPLSRSVCFHLLRQHGDDLPPQLVTTFLNRLSGSIDEQPDTTLQADGTSTRVHRDVLVHWSPYFADRLGKPPAASTLIDLSGDVPGKALGIFVQYMYSGALPPVSALCWAAEDEAGVEKRRREILDAARFLKIEPLRVLRGLR
ncbi:hypothetical protein BJY01DRAFT_250634 [Aspergillus pseudoustus]|uniref:BTB domain-containing protein n=1 Tax=Aspergillus pseudoustus TaxID=1810923 RepID=A0ABR4JGB8_9EURO